MATLADYGGREFGSFRIGEHIGSGQEADVFTCRHQQTGLVFVLRIRKSWKIGIRPKVGDVY